MYIASHSVMRHTRFRRWMKIAAALATSLAGATGVHGETRFTSFTFENDFFAGFDRHYTNGMQAAFLTDLERAPEWLRALSADPQAVIAIGQRMYTPTNKDTDAPDPHDRPYAGWAYVMGDLRTRAGPTIDHVTVALGVVGPASGARQTQNNVHDLIGDAPARGWDTQVRNRTTFMAGYERAWPNVVQGTVGSRHWDLALRAGATAGTPLTYASAGAVLRYGAHLPTDLPVTHISIGPPRDGFRGAPQFGWYVWAGFDTHAVAYNSFLQASTYSGGGHVDRRSFGTDAQVGAAAVWPRARVGFTLIQRSREFAGQAGSDRFGQLAVSFAY
jgi:lipid A 3-O-deacylase